MSLIKHKIAHTHQQALGFEQMLRPGDFGMLSWMLDELVDRMDGLPTKGSGMSGDIGPIIIATYMPTDPTMPHHDLLIQVNDIYAHPVSQIMTESLRKLVGNLRVDNRTKKRGIQVNLKKFLAAADIYRGAYTGRKLGII